ncbi:hypothetical protein Y032_0250g157 [Ancylostoma ceylanicum]|uniref:Uncharacterized protein n=1 Tax=Ancylostoma ceylanicum TaxID=53326 RepID=A0A016SCA6_9BILA|nr:hypothetical protein Y032_0250g157 [Ancylostoma ceylanicum]
MAATGRRCRYDLYSMYYADPAVSLLTRADESPNFLSTRRCDHPKKCEFFKFLSCATSSVELLIIRNLIQYCGLRIASHHHITWEQSV